MVIEIKVAEKVARLKDKTAVGVCGNSDYVIRFSFDAEWDAYETKTARFKWNGTYMDVVFTGNECAMPIIYNSHMVEIGVYADSLHTTTAANLFMKKSVLCDSGAPAAPSDDVYAQIMSKLNNLDIDGYEELKAELESYYTKAETDEFLKYAGRVKSVNGEEPDESGNVTLDIPAPDLSGYYTKTETDELLPQIATTIDADSTDTAAASAKAVYDAIQTAIGGVENGSY